MIWKTKKDGEENFVDINTVTEMTEYSSTCDVTDISTCKTATQSFFWKENT